MNTKSLDKQLLIQKMLPKTILTYLNGCASFTILVPTNMKLFKTEIKKQQ